jgi:hypothetical protein
MESKENPMPSSAPIDALNAHVREAFDEAWLAIFQSRVRAPQSRRQLHQYLLGFTTHYRRLTALPRRTRRSMERKWKRTLSAIALLMTLGQAPVWAAIIEVTPGTPPSIKADGKCSLIEAIVNANRDARTHRDCVAGSGTDTILLPTHSQQTLNGQELIPSITSRIMIEGHGSTIRRNTASDPNNPTYLTFLSVNASGNLTLNKTTVTGAVAGTSRAYGYGISNAGRVTLNDSHLADTGGLLNYGGVAILTDSTVTGSVSSPIYIHSRGGIQNSGTLTLTNSVVSGNEAGFHGGGITNRGTATLIGSLVSGNDAKYDGLGGGIFNTGTLVLIDTTVSDNGADVGGGIWNSGTATLRRSTITGNRASVYGGGGISSWGDLTLSNSTVSNNRARYYGGGIYSGGSHGSLTLISSTVTGNSSIESNTYYGRDGGGIFVFSGTLTLGRSIVSGNTSALNPEVDVVAGVAVTVNDFNLFGHDGDAGVSGFVTGSTDIVPNKSLGRILLPLADNGGPTRTHALAIGSPALDASPDDATCPTIDQRGNPRPRGPACDIGAFEGVAVLCNGKVTTMVGTINDDDLTGTAGPDVISGLLGNDTVTGLGGNDVICAGAGDDVVYGGSGADVVLGEPGDDRLFGQGGNDTLNGGADRDRCDGGAGSGDTVIACENVTGVP